MLCYATYLLKYYSDIKYYKRCNLAKKSHAYMGTSMSLDNDDWTLLNNTFADRDASYSLSKYPNYSLKTSCVDLQLGLVLADTRFVRR